MSQQFRLSHSALEVLHTCERKYQLQRLLQSDTEGEDTGNAHLSFGHSIGAGVASYLQHQDQDRALFDAWMAYWPEEENDKKSVVRAQLAMQAAFHHLDNILMEYELVYFEGKPAVELSFRLNIDESYYFVGYIDVVLQNRFSGRYGVFEVKTTGLELLDLSPLYKHSGQALGYSITLDRIVGKNLAEYDVLYFVCQLKRDFNSIKFHLLPFQKTLYDRFNWFITLGLDVKHLKEMAELNIYPKREDACLHFMKPCVYFGTCNLHSFDIPKKLEEDSKEYQFVYEMNDLVQDHLKRIQENA